MSWCPDSGGAGKWRGGLGVRREYRPLGHDVTFSGQGERFASRPWGLFGGQPGAPGAYAVLRGGDERQALSIKPSGVTVTPDDVVSVITPGAGGYGPPEERDPATVQMERLTGKFSDEYVEAHYGTAPPCQGRRQI